MLHSFYFVFILVHFTKQYRQNELFNISYFEWRPRFTIQMKNILPVNPIKHYGQTTQHGNPNNQIIGRSLAIQPRNRHVPWKQKGKGIGKVITTNIGQ